MPTSSARSGGFGSVQGKIAALGRAEDRGDDAGLGGVGRSGVAAEDPAVHRSERRSGGGVDDQVIVEQIERPSGRDRQGAGVKIAVAGGGQDGLGSRGDGERREMLGGG